MKSVTVKVQLIFVTPDSEGAARLLAHLSTPRRTAADMRKLQNFCLSEQGDRPLDNRTKAEVRCGVVDHWRRLRHAADVGEMADRMFANANREKLPEHVAAVFPASLTSMLDGRDPERYWDPWKPVVHMAGAFHEMLMTSRRGSWFHGSPDDDEKVRQVRELLLLDHGWMRETVEQAQARFGLYRLHGGQQPASPRFFVFGERRATMA